VISGRRPGGPPAQPWEALSRLPVSVLRGRRPVHVRALTVKERIQLHLFDFSRLAEAYEAPPGVTQEAIARAAGIRVHHVTQYIRPLVAEGHVEEKTSHVRGRARRRKVYFLTASGRLHASSLRNALLSAHVPFRDRMGETHDLPLSRIHQEERRGATVLELLTELQTDGYISEARPTGREGLVDFTQEAARVQSFYGREKELAEVLRALGEKPVVVVTGMAGIGKTTLGSRICEELRGKRSLFWRGVCPWDTAIDLAARVSVFLRSLNRTELHGFLAGTAPKELARVEEPLARDLAGVGALLVFDDVQNASEEAQAFLAILVRALKPQKGTSALLLSRSTPAFYSRREVAVEASVMELPLHGLDPTSSVTILKEAGIADPLLGSLVESCGGIPLFLKLVASAGPGAPPEESWRTLETYIAEQIDPSLAKEERECLEIASFYHLPVPPEAMLLTSGARRRILIDLHRKGLVTSTDSGRFVVHDALRSYFQGSLPAERRASIASEVARWLSGKSDEAKAQGRPHEAVAYLGNAAVVEVDPGRRGSILAKLGDLRRLVGDYPGAIEAYRAGARDASDRAAVARLHAKIAVCLENLGQLGQAVEEIDKGLSLVPQEPSLEAAWLLYQRASVAYAREDYGRALAGIEQVTSWMVGLPRDEELWGFLSNLRGLIHFYDHERLDFSLAQADFQEAVDAWDRAGYTRGLCNAYNNLFLAAYAMGKGEQALEYLDRSAALAEATGDTPARTTVLFTKAYYLTEHVGDYDAAGTLYDETYRLAKETHQRAKLAFHYHHYANLYEHQGRLEEARESLEYFIQTSGDMVGVDTKVEACAWLSRIRSRLGDVEAAEASLGQAERLAATTTAKPAAHAIEWAKATLAAARGDLEAAGASFRRAFDLSTPPDRGKFLLEYGQFLASNGERNRAKEVLGLACEELAKMEGATLKKAQAEFRSLEEGVPERG